MTPGGATNAIGLLVEQHRSPQRAERPAQVDVYAADGANELTGAARFARALVYVPNSQANTLDVIDQRSLKVIAHYDVGALPQHVTPSYDLRTLYVDNDLSSSLTPIDPATGRPRGHPDPRDRSVQPLFHSWWAATRSSSPNGASTSRLPHGARDATHALAGGAVPRSRPSGLHGRRITPARELRVLRRPRGDRRCPSARRTHHWSPVPRQHAAGREALAGRVARSSSPICAGEVSG